VRGRQKLRYFASAPDYLAHPYAYVPFEVGQGVTRIEVKMRYPKAPDCVIDFGCLDAEAGDFPTKKGFRGWSGGAREHFFIARDEATPGYLPGEMIAGTWHFILGLYKVPSKGVEIELEVTCDSEVRPLFAAAKRALPRRGPAGWYRGDLHCHTHHSDAKGTPETLNAAARQAGLDFLAVSDHNTISQWRYFDQQSTPELVFVRAMEVTTARGHANVFGLSDWVDFRMTKPEDAHDLADRVHKQGAALSINHDKPGNPWEYEFPKADCMEVWQSSWMAMNWVSLARYQSRLASGQRITAIGGSDYHQPARLMPEGPFVLARPTTVLWLTELSERAIIAAMKAGRAYISEAPNGPHLSIMVNGANMGEEIRANRVRGVAETGGAMGDFLHWIDASGLREKILIKSDDFQARFDGEVNGFLRAEIVAGASRQKLLNEANNALGARGWPLGLTHKDIAAQALRRAISSPVYVSAENSQRDKQR